MKNRELAKKIYNTSHITGEFLLRSGKISNEYFDKYLFEAQPELLDEITSEMKELVPEGSDLLAGLEMGGIPIATSLALKTKQPTLFVRKEAKQYGTCKLAEGADFKGKKVCIIEDVVTTGGQIIISANQLRELGAEIDSVMCVIVREEKAFENLAKEGLNLIPLYTMEELKESVA